MLLLIVYFVLCVCFDGWLESEWIVLCVVGEFEDSVLMVVFVVCGFGVFVLSEFGVNDVLLLCGFRWFGCVGDVIEEIYVICFWCGEYYLLMV